MLLVAVPGSLSQSDIGVVTNDLQANPQQRGGSTVFRRDIFMRNFPTCFCDFRSRFEKGRGTESRQFELVSGFVFGERFILI